MKDLDNTEELNEFEEVYKEFKDLSDAETDFAIEDILKEVRGEAEETEVKPNLDNEKRDAPIAPLSDIEQFSDSVAKQVEDAQSSVFVNTTAEEYAEYICERDGDPEGQSRFEKYLEGDGTQQFSVDKDTVDKLFKDFEEEEPKEKQGFFSKLFNKQEETETEEFESEYESYQDEEREEAFIKDNYKTLSNDMVMVQTGLRSRFIIATIVAVLLFYVELSGVYKLPIFDFMNMSINVPVNMFVQMLLYASAMIASHKEIVNGVRSMVALRAEPDSIMAFSAIVVLIHGIVQIGSALTGETFLFYGGVIAIVMSLTLFTKMIRIKNICSNLAILKKNKSNISLEKIKDRALLQKLLKKTEEAVVVEDLPAETVGKREVTHQQEKIEEEISFANIVYEGRISETYDYEDMAFSIDESHIFSSYATPIVICYSILMTALYVFFKKDAANMFTVFAMTAIMVTPFTMEMAYTIPFGNLATRLRERGNVALGSEAIQKLYDCDGVVVEDAYIFEKGSIYLKGMKVFGDVRIDEIFVDMASVLADMKCAVAGVFMNILQNDESLLRRVKGWECDTGQGVVAVMDDEKTLFIGKKEYMVKNGFEIHPVLNKEGKDISSSGNVLYVGSQHRIFCAFEICYDAGTEITELMNILHNNDVTVYFKSCDMFLDKTFMEANFNVNVESFCMIEEEAYMDVEELMYTEVCGTSGIYLKNHNLENLADIVCECKRMRNIVKRNLMITAASIALSPLLVLLIYSQKSIETLNPLVMLGCLGLWIVPLIINSKD